MENTPSATTYPLGQTPLLILLKIIKKMSFRESARMRQTCHAINDLIQLNRKTLRFPAEQCDILLVMYDIQGELTFTPYLQCNLPEDSVHCEEISELASIEGVIFEKISWMFTRKVPDAQEFVQFFRANRIGCRRLNFPYGLKRSFKLIDVYKASGATAVSVTGPILDVSERNLPFLIIQKLADLKCRELSLHDCDEFPLNYADILAQIETVTIRRIVTKENHPFSVLSIVQKMLTDHTMPMKHFQLPCRQFLERSEIEMLGLAEWRFDLRTPVNGIDYGFLIETSNDIVILHRTRIGVEYFCTCERFSKNHLAEFVSKWSQLYIRSNIPFDASGIFEYVQGNLKDFGTIRNYLLDSAHSFI